MDKETNVGARLALGLNKAYITLNKDTPEVTEEDAIITKHDLTTETSDLLQGLARHLITEDEDPEFSGQTVVEVKTRSGATETIMEIDNMDVKTDVPVNGVLGANKGHDLDERIGKLETGNLLPTIEMDATMTTEDRTGHQYPSLQLSNDQVNIITQHNATLLKVKYSISDAINGTETDTLVFYTTVDDNVVVDSGNTVRTIKINAVRTNYEGTIVYHGELLGNDEVFMQSMDLTPKYIPFATE